MPDNEGSINLTSRLSTLETKVSEIERQVWTASIKFQEGVASARETTELREIIRSLREEVTVLNKKTTKWEGGGSIIYIVITLIGGVLGWLSSHLGLGGK